MTHRLIHRFFLSLLGLCYLPSGCQPMPPSTPADWSAISACLPADVKLDHVFCPDREACPPAERTTVKQKLMDMGVYAKDGKLYDRSGREIRFHRIPRSGPPPTREKEQADRDHLEDLRRRYTVITLYALEGGV